MHPRGRDAPMFPRLLEMADWLHTPHPKPNPDKATKREVQPEGNPMASPYHKTQMYAMPSMQWLDGFSVQEPRQPETQWLAERSRAYLKPRHALVVHGICFLSLIHI